MWWIKEGDAWIWRIGLTMKVQLFQNQSSLRWYIIVSANRASFVSPSILIGDRDMSLDMAKQQALQEVREFLTQHALWLDDARRDLELEIQNAASME
jgi:hypothetical protein